MSDPYPADAQPSGSRTVKSPKSLFERFSALLRREPEDRDELKVLLEDAHERQLVDADAYAMIVGALAVSELTAADVMVPRSRIDALDISRPLAELLPYVIEAAHSRFPVYEETRDNIIGILLAKDLLQCMQNPEVEIRSLVRPAVFIPQSKRLNVLLREFRVNRNHLVIVVDEHGGIAGLVTMENVLEQIVGDIEDEFDEEAEQTIFPDGENRWRVMATTEIDRFNEAFNAHLETDEYDTVGGWLADELEHIPRRGDTVERDNLVLQVTRADARRALWLTVQVK
ncbi:CBS domain-containing protein [Verticiella sediminum]|uniref:Magnesium and cobalt efflux protein CorC n=1 Tax=Verticiella sediminum TaxID=1247510 RepID=A0A556ALR1_9BURK|nr:transporter associated domain-containing protein [Verticiella sediminum]TSH93834.1 CBS domain-containing protein [Verticiella sediminum]